MQSGPANSSARITFLDGLRGVAILLVLMLHVNDRAGGPFAPDAASRLFGFICGFGWIGVDLFFVLSGFLITGILLETREAPRYFTNFYARRFLRIFPLYYGFIALSLWAFPAIFPFTGLEVRSSSAWPYACYIANLRQDWSLGAPALGVFWSLCVEEHFYLIWPAIVLAVPISKLPKVCIGLVIASFLLRSTAMAWGVGPWLAYRATPFRLEGLAIGAIVAIAWRDPIQWTQLQRLAPLACVSGSALSIGIGLGQRHFLPLALATPGSEMTVGVGITAVSVFFGGLLVMLLSSPQSGFRKVLEFPALRSAGKYSYAAYVFHAAIIMLCAPPVERWAQSAGVPDVICKLILLVYVSLMTFTLAWLSYHLYERHFLSLKQYFAPTRAMGMFSNSPQHVRVIAG